MKYQINSPCIVHIVQGDIFSLVIKYPNGKVFYTPKRGTLFNGYFALPVGVWVSNLKLEKTNLKRNIPQLDNFERDMKHDFSKFNFEYTKNDAVATIDHNKKTISFDNSLQEKPIYYQLGILYHEIGHNFYENEFSCDKYAMVRMIQEGYNQTQILEAFNESFKTKHPAISARKTHINELLQNYGHIQY